VKDLAARPQSEIDVLKFYIWLMVVMTLALLGALWYVSDQLDTTKKNLALGVSLKDDFEKEQAQVLGMLNVYRGNKEDVARYSPNIWFSALWVKRGITNNSIIPGNWKVPPSFNNKGKFYEESIDWGVNAKAPLPRQSVVDFCYDIEKASTRLRILELEVRRADMNNFDKDEWAGKVTVGYRHARLD
jgi:hypothetical protein